jgi:hypothetical protein
MLIRGSLERLRRGGKRLKMTGTEIGTPRPEMVFAPRSADAPAFEIADGAEFGVDGGRFPVARNWRGGKYF